MLNVIKVNLVKKEESLFPRLTDNGSCPCVWQRHLCSVWLTLLQKPQSTTNEMLF